MGKKTTFPSLNPCFNGRYSRSAFYKVSTDGSISVLILVLMEDTLGVRNATKDTFEKVLS